LGGEPGRSFEFLVSSFKKKILLTQNSKLETFSSNLLAFSLRRQSHFLFLGGAGSALHMVLVSPQWEHFLGLQRVSILLPHFSQVKTAIAEPPVNSFFY
jgi:hypothetical protein